MESINNWQWDTGEQETPELTQSDTPDAYWMMHNTIHHLAKHRTAAGKQMQTYRETC